MATPKVRIDSPVNLPELDCDLIVIGGNVQNVVPLPISFIIEQMVTFYPDVLRTHINCDVENCNGHYKFGVCFDRNLPVIFGYHKRETAAYYFAFVPKATLPFKVPNTRGLLMDGIKW